MADNPLVVILADPHGTVATDLMTPYAILAESGAVTVRVAASAAGPVRLIPGYSWVVPQVTLAELNRGHGPDVVIVPAYEKDDDRERSAWLAAELERGARIMSICNGARALAAAGLLDGREATVHWYSQGKVARAHPEVRWRRDVRWIADGPITTTAGISAAEPATLALLQDLVGEAVMRETAERLKLALPDQHHLGRAYRLTRQGMGTVVLNQLAVWSHQKVAVPIEAGFDEIAFGAAMDAWSRTYRSTAWATGAPAVRSRHGLVVCPDHALPHRFDRTVQLASPDVMVHTFEQVREAYGEPTARFVALQFEHPWGAVEGAAGSPALTPPG